MVVVAQGHGWWIESFSITRVSVAAGAQLVTTHTLERPGVFVAGSATLDHNEGATVGLVTAAMRDVDNTQLFPGENVVAIETILSNGSGGALAVGLDLLVIIRTAKNSA